MSDSARPSGRWRPGQSGNPAGKPPGSGALQKLRAQVAAEMPGVIQRLVLSAREGDVQAAKLLLDRVFPALKPTEHVELPAVGSGALTARADAILTAVGSGQISAATGRHLISALASVAKLREVEELEERLSALERRLCEGQ